jgi:hypothetical protein
MHIKILPVPRAVCSHVGYNVAVDILSTKGLASWQSANLREVRLQPLRKRNLCSTAVMRRVDR